MYIRNLKFPVKWKETHQRCKTFIILAKCVYFSFQDNIRILRTPQKECADQSRISQTGCQVQQWHSFNAITFRPWKYYRIDFSGGTPLLWYKWLTVVDHMILEIETIRSATLISLERKWMDRLMQCIFIIFDKFSEYIRSLWAPFWFAFVPQLILIDWTVWICINYRRCSKHSLYRRMPFHFPHSLVICIQKCTNSIWYNHHKLPEG